MPNPIRANETAVRPPVITKMPDPATLPCVSLLGVVKVPVALRGGFTAATLDAKLGRGARFGVRCSSHETMCKYLHERMNDTGAHFGLLNLLNTTGGQFAANGCTSKYVEVLPMMRPGEPEPRERVSVRVLVVDSASAIPKRPRDVAVEVAVNDTVGTLVDTIRETCAVSRDETLLLTNVAFKPNTALNADASSYGECRVSHVYTTRDGSFRTRPARGVKGFARAFPPESGYEFKHTDRGLGVGRFAPDRSKTRDVLVAYVLPKDAKQLAVVNPTYHFDFKAPAADAKKQTEAQAAYDERKGTRRRRRTTTSTITAATVDRSTLITAGTGWRSNTPSGRSGSPSSCPRTRRKSRRTNRSRRRGGASGEARRRRTSRPASNGFSRRACPPQPPRSPRRRSKASAARSRASKTFPSRS